MTSLGPLMIHCGAAVSVGVRVIVSDGISIAVGDTVVVSVKAKVWVGMAIKVGDGTGLAVLAGSNAIVGRGSAVKFNPPQARDTRVRNDMGTKYFLKPIAGDSGPRGFANRQE